MPGPDGTTGSLHCAADPDSCSIHLGAQVKADLIGKGFRQKSGRPQRL